MKRETRLPKGVWFQRKKLADGEVIRYGYYGRGVGTESLGREGSAEFHARLSEILRREPEARKVTWLIWRYKSSPEFAKLRERTRLDYHRHLDKILEKFGRLSLDAMAAPQIADHIYAWRDKLAQSSPRQADYSISVLAAMLAWGVQHGLVALNRAAGVGDVYKADRTKKLWTEELQEHFLVYAPEPVRRFFILAVETGLSQEDLLVLPWTAIRDGVIIAVRLKNGVPVAIPISPRLQAVLDAAPRGKDLQVLTKADGHRWDAKGNGLRAAFRETKAAAGIVGLTFHDLRGTFITHRRANLGWTSEETALCSGHKVSGEQGAQGAYVDRAAVALANANRLAAKEYGANSERLLQTALQTAAQT